MGSLTTLPPLTDTTFLIGVAGGLLGHDVIEDYTKDLANKAVDMFGLSNKVLYGNFRYNDLAVTLALWILGSIAGSMGQKMVETALKGLAIGYAAGEILALELL